MTDPYRITTTTDTPPDPHEPAATSGPTEIADVVLWVVLALGVAGNVATSATGQSLLGVPFGVAVIVSAVALVKRHLGRRK